MNRYLILVWVLRARLYPWALIYTFLCGVLFCSGKTQAQVPYTMTVNYLNNQPSMTTSVWAVRSLVLTTSVGSLSPDKVAISYRASTTPTTSIALATIRDITFSGSPLYTGDTLRITRKSALPLNIAGIQKITFENMSTRVDERVGNVSSAGASSTLVYPNPSSSLTNIEFLLLQGGDITAVVYDIQGNHVRTLTRGYHEAGKHTVQWNRINSENKTVAAGLYVCRITSGSALLAETMIVFY